jgi:hypothetical protein
MPYANILSPLPPTSEMTYNQWMVAQNYNLPIMHNSAFESNTPVRSIANHNASLSVSQQQNNSPGNSVEDSGAPDASALVYGPGPPIVTSNRVKGSRGCNLFVFHMPNEVTNWDLYLYDIQTYTSLVLNSSLSNNELPATSFVKGKSSGASGYAVSAGGGSPTITLSQTSGTFSVGEQLIINGIDFPRTITTVNSFGTQEIKSVKQSGISGYPTFTADCLLESFSLPNSVVQATISGGTTVRSPGKVFTGIKTDTILEYQTTSGDKTYNRVTAVAADGLSLTIAGVTPNVSGVYTGSVINGTYPITIASAIIRNQDSGYLYAELPDSNISSVNLSDSLLTVSEQLTGKTISSGKLILNTSDFTGITSAFFAAFDEERYSVYYTGGGIGTVTSDSFSLNSATNQVTFSGLTNGSNAVVNATLIKNGIQSKLKQYTRSQTISVNLSKYSQSGSGISSSINDGLTYNQYYGLRVQDEEISLNYPDVVKVLAVYE